MRYSVSQILTKWRHLWTVPFAWSQLIGLIHDEANINSAQRSIELINVTDGNTCGPA